MRDISLIEFIETGRLGFIQLGSAKSDIKRVFGQPKHKTRWAVGQNIDPVAWEFDNLVIGFDIETEEVCIIELCRHKINQVPSVGHKAAILNYGIKFGMVPEDFEKILENNGIYYKEKMRWDENGWILEYSSGVEVGFQENDSNDALLSNFYLQCR